MRCKLSLFCDKPPTWVLSMHIACKDHMLPPHLLPHSLVCRLTYHPSISSPFFFYGNRRGFFPYWLLFKQKIVLSPISIRIALHTHGSVASRQHFTTKPCEIMDMTAKSAKGKEWLAHDRPPSGLSRGQPQQVCWRDGARDQSMWRLRTVTWSWWRCCFLDRNALPAVGGLLLVLVLGLQRCKRVVAVASKRVGKVMR